ncbi:N-6 DNA methylase [Paraburkholderia atlantica]|uniref:N-6 DNA methylase n=1 Tax=Paraburkholderia atlantica TaxID=2654982 RepID=UPI0003A91953|nr:N-6 DNA methylase [Paraburkholderia atlantica]
MENNLEGMPVYRAYRKLVDLARMSGSGHETARLYALTWLAAARMKMVSAGTRADFDALVLPPAWNELEGRGLPHEAATVACRTATGVGQDLTQRATAVGIVRELVAELADLPWDVLPFLGTEDGVEIGDFPGAMPRLAELLLDLLGPVGGAGELWIPFDANGQLSLRAMRRGWNVIAVSPMGGPRTILELLLAIEFGSICQPRVSWGGEKDAVGRNVTKAEYVLAMPPIGMRVKGTRLEEWSSGSPSDSEQFDRSEAWAIHEFVNRATRRAVFATGAGVLFSKGQEHRLRVALLDRGGELNQLEAVLSLPAGAFTNTNILGAALVINLEGSTAPVRMIELTSSKRSTTEANELIELGRALWSGERGDKARVTSVTHDEIAENEFVLSPTRYLGREVNKGRDAKPLGEYFTVVRPPSPSKQLDGEVVSELGIPDLGAWVPRLVPPEKTVMVRPDLFDDVYLATHDLVISIKGTVGKVGLVGVLQPGQKWVPSQSCVGLRLKSDPTKAHDLLDYIFMYLRSEECTEQIARLQVGAGVPHISPATLLSSLMIPTPASDELKRVTGDCRRLREIEGEIFQLQEEMRDISSRNWPGLVDADT